MLNKIILIHPTKCAGTTISKRLLKLKGFSEKDSAFYSGYYFNRFFQKNIQFFYFIFHSKSLIKYFIRPVFYCICFYFVLRNLFAKNKYGLTSSQGSIQHFTYTQWKKLRKISDDSIFISIVTHPQHRIVSSFYFLGYDKHYSFPQFLRKIQDGSLLSSIPFLGFRAIIRQHIISMYDYLIDENGENNIDFIFKKESLDDDWKKFCVKHQLKHKALKHINKTTSIRDWKDLYRIHPDASRLVYDLYKKDFEYFNYKIINICEVV